MLIGFDCHHYNLEKVAFFTGKDIKNHFCHLRQFCLFQLKEGRRRYLEKKKLYLESKKKVSFSQEITVNFDS